MLVTGLKWKTKKVKLFDSKPEISTGHRTLFDKNRVMSYLGWFRTETVVQGEIKCFLLSCRRLKTQKHSVSIGVCCLGFFMIILIDNLLVQFFHIPNCMMCLSKKILYQHFVVFLSCLKQLLPWKQFICHYIALET